MTTDNASRVDDPGASRHAGDSPDDADKCRCKQDHHVVTLAEWIWGFRDTTPKPSAALQAALVMLASRLDAGTGCGWASVTQASKDAGVSEDTVSRAIIWAMKAKLLHRVVRGHRRGDGTSTISCWQLAQPRTSAVLRAGSTPLPCGIERSQPRWGAVSTPQGSGLNPAGERC